MHEPNTIVINTGPIISLVAACGDLTLLRALYTKVIVPFEVGQEIIAGGAAGFAVQQFEAATWLNKVPEQQEIGPFLLNTLDRGEASVVQFALNANIRTVCIDETIGRRIARLNGLRLTGSIGILLRAKREGHIDSVKSALQRMRDQGIWLSERILFMALKEAGEYE